MFKKNLNTTVECKPDRNRPADLICNRCRKKEELVRSGEYMPIKLKTCEMSQFGGKAVVECESNCNLTVDLTWNRKPDSNQTADLTRNRKPDGSKPRVSRTVHFHPQRSDVKTMTANHLNPWFLETITICTEQKTCIVTSPGFFRCSQNHDQQTPLSNERRRAIVSHCIKKVLR